MMRAYQHDTRKVTPENDQIRSTSSHCYRSQFYIGVITGHRRARESDPYQQNNQSRCFSSVVWQWLIHFSSIAAVCCLRYN